ncbi:DHDH [Acanthosepion pharaonis]|uniref:Trans-1,2-dihydrobenzene-1,2-diol dehydrogenase n=1 Tax=Acanthosepion pharaonis TaxID=158019 RepID=A0A812B6J8_ACAPH|nr:DHDH [Sepia pharaonis]
MKWGICGTGKICNDFCGALQLLNHDDHQITAVADRDIDSAQKFAEKFKIPKAFGCYEDFAREPTVDIVYIGVVSFEHCRLSIMMLNNGKHVLCEKPVTLNLKELEKVLKVAKDKQLFFMEALWSRFFPAYEKVRNAMDSKSLGEVRYVQAEFCLPVFNCEQVKKRELGGGGLLYIGIYAIQWALLAFKEKPDKIFAVGHLHETGVDQSATIIFKYKGGQMANLTYNTEIQSECTASICGTKGRIQLPYPFWAPTKVTINEEEMEFPLSSGEFKFNLVNSAGLSYEAECVRKCIEKGQLECPLFPHSESITIMTIMDEVRRQLGVKYDVDDIEP